MKNYVWVVDCFVNKGGFLFSVDNRSFCSQLAQSYNTPFAQLTKRI
jgi:hypothetical protein